MITSKPYVSYFHKLHLPGTRTTTLQTGLERENGHIQNGSMGYLVVLSLQGPHRGLLLLNSSPPRLGLEKLTHWSMSRFFIVILFILRSVRGQSVLCFMLNLQKIDVAQIRHCFEHYTSFFPRFEAATAATMMIRTSTPTAMPMMAVIPNVIV